jgi:RNA polymerase sigma factor (sigma-70 family)
MVTNEKIKVLSELNTQWVKTAYSFISNSNGVSEAEDIVQDTYIKLLDTNKIDSVVSDSGDINRSYMYLAIRSVSYDYLRINQREVKRLVKDADETYIVNVIDEVNKDFESLVDKMNKEVNSWHWYDKQLFKLYKEGTHSMQKLADDTGISKTSIFTTIKACKQKLREALGKDYLEYLETI